MADKDGAASGRKAQEDPNRVAEEVVNSLKSQGLFDHFRKECLDEVENMVICFLLKRSNVRYDCLLLA